MNKIVVLVTKDGLGFILSVYEERKHLFGFQTEKCSF